MEVLEDRSETLWVGARSGLLRFDRTRERFEAVDLEPSRPPLADLEVTALAEDRQGRLWVAQGPELFVRETDGGFHRVTGTERGEGDPVDLILEVEIAPAGEVWLLLGDAAYRTTAVARLTGTGALERFPLSGKEALGRAFYFDPADKLWLSAARAPQPVPPARRLPAKIPVSTGVQVVAQATDGTTWLGTMGEGLYRLPPDDPASLELYRLGQSWQENYVLDLRVDRAGSLWVATLAGLWRYDPGARPFRHLGVRSGEEGGLGAPAVSSIRKGPDGGVWIGTFGGGLQRLEESTGRVEHFHRDPTDPDSLCDDTIWALHVDGKGRLWIGGGSSLCVRDPRTGRFRRITPPGSWNRPLDTRVLGEGADGSVLMGFSVHGLWALEPGSGRWTLLARIEGQLTSLEVIDGSEVWIGFHTGLLARIDPRSGERERIELTAPTGERLTFLTIYDIHRGSDGRLWLATDGGLARLDPGSRRVEYPIAAADLPGSVCFSIEPDGSGRLWIDTNQGLARLDPEAPEGARVWVFDRGDGLGNIEFNRGAAYRLMEFPSGKWSVSDALTLRARLPSSPSRELGKWSSIAGLSSAARRWWATTL